jgi:hypothetical protein
VRTHDESFDWSKVDGEGSEDANARLVVIVGFDSSVSVLIVRFNLLHQTLFLMIILCLVSIVRLLSLARL